MTPFLTAWQAIALFGGAALVLDLALHLRDRWRRRGVLATGADSWRASQNPETRHA